MKRLLLFAAAVVAALFMALPAHAQTPQNITPHDSQPIQPVIVTVDPTGSCTNYALTYINWKTGAQTVCANGNYLTSQTGGGGGIPYPAAGIPLSTGSAWTSSVTAPSGAIVGTTDTQTLTNKTVDGVSPLTFTYLDATSSIQQQINARLTGIGIQVAGSAVGTAQILNLQSGFTATVSGGIAAITATGGGGSIGGLLATAASNTSTLTVGTDCTTGTPCILGVGSLSLAKITASMTATASTGAGTNDTFYVYLDTANGNALTIGDGGTVTLTTPGSGAGSGMVVAGSAITGFPVDSLPLFSGTITSDNFTAVSDQRAIYRAGKRIIAGSNVTVTDAADSVTIASTGGSSFNGGTITNPLFVTGTGSAPFLGMSFTDGTQYGIVSDMTNDAGKHYQLGLAGSGTGEQANAPFLYDNQRSEFIWIENTKTGALWTADGVGLNRLNGDPGTCDSDHNKTLTTDTSGRPEYCDGSAWHHLQFSD